MQVCRGTDSWGKTFISVAFPRQSALQSVSQRVNPRSAFIINHRITLGRSPNDVGWRGTSHDRICNCLHNAQQVRYQAPIWSANIAWGLCSYYCRMMVAASGAAVKVVSTEPRAEKMHLSGCCVNKCDWMLVCQYKNSISLRHGHWFFYIFIYRWKCFVEHTSFSCYPDFTPHSCLTQVSEATWPPILEQCVHAVSELAIYQHLFIHRNPPLPPRIITVLTCDQLRRISWEVKCH